MEQGDTFTINVVEDCATQPPNPRIEKGIVEIEWRPRGKQKIQGISSLGPFFEKPKPDPKNPENWVAKIKDRPRRSPRDINYTVQCGPQAEGGGNPNATPAQLILDPSG